MESQSVANYSNSLVTVTKTDRVTMSPLAVATTV